MQNVSRHKIQALSRVQKEYLNCDCVCILFIPSSRFLRALPRENECSFLKNSNLSENLLTKDATLFSRHFSHVKAHVVATSLKAKKIQYIFHHESTIKKYITLCILDKRREKISDVTWVMISVSVSGNNMTQ